MQWIINDSYGKYLMSDQCYWVYILLCENGNYYTGYTNDLTKRYQSHMNGTASKYTRSFKPRCIAQSWKVNGDKSLAMQIERNIKKLSRAEKEKIILYPTALMKEIKIIG
jgi:putative endonuclease